MTSPLTKALTSQPKRHSRTVEAAASCIKLDSFLRQPTTTCPGNGPSHNGQSGLDMAAGEYDLGVSSVEAVLSALTVIQLCPGASGQGLPPQVPCPRNLGFLWASSEAVPKWIQI